MTSDLHAGHVEVAGGRLFFERAGAGAPIVWIHAAIADRRMWNREFTAYAPGRTLVRYDVRGLGRSPGATAPYSDSEDLKSLFDQLELPPATLVGCSNGGRIALDFAIAHPDRVRALLLVAPGVSGFTAEHAPEGAAVYEQDGVRSSAIGALWKAGQREEAMEQLRLYWESAQEGANVELGRQMIRENAEEIFSEASASHSQPLQPPAIDRLDSVRAPTRILIGDRDEPTMTFIVRTIARGIPNSRLIPVPGADHLINLSRPREFDAALRELL